MNNKLVSERNGKGHILIKDFAGHIDQELGRNLKIEDGLSSRIEEIDMNDYSEIEAFESRYKIVISVKKIKDTLWEIKEKAPEKIDYLQNRRRRLYVNPKSKEILEEYYY